MIFEEYDENKKAIINPWQTMEKIEGMPEIAITCFSYDLLEKILNGIKHTQIADLHSTNGYNPIYEIEYNGMKFALFMMIIGAPAAASCLDEAHAMGINKFIVFGNCGVLDENIEDCGVIIPTSAIRDEGTSYHYAPPTREIKVNNKYIDIFKEILDEWQYNYTEGKTWTTDAFYRETKKKVESRKNEGAICVEMECSAMQAVANFRNFDLFTFFYAADNLVSEVWDERSLSGSVKLDEKSAIAILALELAYRIMKSGE